MFALTLRFRAAEDDTDDELVEEHVTKVCERHMSHCNCKNVIRASLCYIMSVTHYTEVRLYTHCVLRFTTAAVLTPSWPSLSTRFKRVLSARTSVWSPWAHGRYVHAHTHAHKDSQ